MSLVHNSEKYCNYVFAFSFRFVMISGFLLWFLKIFLLMLYVSLVEFFIFKNFVLITGSSYMWALVIIILIFILHIYQIKSILINLTIIKLIREREIQYCLFNLKKIVFSTISDDFMKQGNGLIVFYTLKNPSFPESCFETDSGVMCIDIHPDHPYEVAAGFYDGSVAVFNTVEKKDGPVHRCTAKNGKHTDPVWQVWYHAITDLDLQIILL